MDVLRAENESFVVTEFHIMMDKINSIELLLNLKVVENSFFPSFFVFIFTSQSSRR